MDRLYNFVRSDLFLSLAGGFALGLAGLAIIKPASANDNNAEAKRSVSVGGPSYEAAAPNP
jgi:hypothetical protein